MIGIKVGAGNPNNKRHPHEEDIDCVQRKNLHKVMTDLLS